MTITDDNILLINFLDTIKERIRNNSLSPLVLEELIRFYQSFYFYESSEPLEESQIKKYLFTGWYIWNNLK